MAAVSGINGRVIWSGKYTSHVHAWSMDVVTDALEDTAWEYTTLTTGGASGASANLGWRSYKAGLSGFSGSFECYHDSVPAGVADGTSAMLYLYVDADTYWYGVAFITGVHPSSTIDGMQTVTIDFQGALHLSMQWVTTTTSSTSTTTSTSTSTTA